MQSNVAFEIFGKPIYWYAIIIVCGIIAAFIVASFIAKKKGYNVDLLIDYLLIALPLGVIGARLYYVAFEWARYADNLISILYVWEGGLAIYGAVIGGIIAAVIFCKKKKVPLGDLLDIVAPALILAQAIGRWGNFMNQEAFGAQVTDPGLQWFPFAVFIERLEGWYLATFFYEFLWNLLVFGALMFYTHKFSKNSSRGNTMVWYLILYGIGRAFIEGLRTDSLYLIRWGNTQDVFGGIVFDGIRVSQALSLLMIIGGIIYLIIRKKKPLDEVKYEGVYSLEYAALKKAEKLAKKEGKIGSKKTEEQNIEDIVENAPENKEDVLHNEGEEK